MVHVVPQNLSVLGIIATRIVLFGSVVDDGDADGGHGHGVAGSVMFFLGLPIASPAQSSSIVMVVTEIAHIVESINIDIFAPFIVVIPKIVHIFLIEECISDPEEEGVVENGVKGAQIASKVPHIAIEDFTYSVDT